MAKGLSTFNGVTSSIDVPDDTLGLTNFLRNWIEEKEYNQLKKSKDSDAFLVNERFKTHARKKYELSKEMPGRLLVCRQLIQRYYDIRRLEYGSDDDYVKHCEAVLDNLLARYEYDIEVIIDKWREILPTLKFSPDMCDTCGYRPPFCGYQWNSECSHSNRTQYAQTNI